jgi:hypothetical protein
MWISRTRLPRRASSTTSGTSVSAISSPLFASTLATSSATFPAPTTATPGWSSGGFSAMKSGWPEYQLTNAPDPNDPARSSPGMPRARSSAQPVAWMIAW